MQEQKFFRCKHCGNFVGLINNAGAPMACCGEPMEELIPNTVEASTEKHLPVVSANGRLAHVEVGAVPHPSEEAHHIEFIYLQTEKGGQRRSIDIGSPAAAMFILQDDSPIAAFAYCNLHGLWKTSFEVEQEDCDCGHDDCGCGHDHGSCDCH